MPVTTANPELSQPSSITRRRRRFLKRRPPKLTWQSASFHFSLSAVFLVITFIWIITPFSWLYVFYTLLTLIPQLEQHRPAPHHLALKIIHYIFLGYCALEIPFTVYYRSLAWKEQKIRPPLRHPRKHLRGLILRSLENGLTLEEEAEQEEHEREEEEDSKEGGGDRGKKSPEVGKETSGDQVWVEGNNHEYKNGGSLSRVQSVVEKSGRKRVNRLKGDGSQTPELSTTDLSSDSTTDYLSARSTLPTLHSNDPLPHSSDDFTRQTGSRISVNTLDSAFGSSSSPRSNHSPLYPPPPSNQKKRNHSFHHGAPISGFIDPPLSPSDPRAQDFRNYLRYWFAGCKFEEIKRLNMADWLAWSLYGMRLESLEDERKEWDRRGRPPLKLEDGSLDEDDEDLLEEDTVLEGDKYGLVMHCVELVEARAAHRFEPGRNEGIKTLRLTLDPVRVTQRPLILYLVVALLQNGVLAATKLKGFKEFKDGNVKYLCRVPKDWIPDPNGTESTRPLVFIHGLGMGSAQYATFMSYLCSHRSFRNRPILILLQPHISMSFFEKAYHSPPDQVTLTKSIERMMKRLKFDEAGGATVLSHSNGTIVHAWLVKHAPELCARNCFVDAVCFCLWEPFVCYNFLYSQPKTPIEYLMRYFVSRELGIAVMLSRTFEWTSNLLFPSQIPNLSDPSKSAVFLASEDSILNAERVKTYLSRNGFIETKGRVSSLGREVDGGGLKVFEGLKHGQSMIGEGAAFEEIMEWVCQAPRGTLAPGTASPPRTAPPSLANSGHEESGIEVSESNNEDA